MGIPSSKATSMWMRGYSLVQGNIQTERVGIPSSKAAFIQNHMLFHLCWLILLKLWVNGSRFQEGSPRRIYPSYWSFVEYNDFIKWSIRCHMHSRDITLSQFQTRAVKTCHTSSYHTSHFYLEGRTSHAISRHITHFALFSRATKVMPLSITHTFSLFT